MFSWPTRNPAGRYRPGWECLALLVIIQLWWAGYRFGTGNQAIQIVFLKHLVDPALYATDPLILTLPSYPSLFLKLLAGLIPLAHLQAWYFGLHALTALAMLAGCYVLARSMFGNRLTGLLTVVMMLAGHHQALASTTLYWQQFTHTWVAFTGAVFVLAGLFRGRWLATALGIGVLFNVHALLAGYAAVLFAGVALAEWRSIGVPRLLWCAVGCLCLAAPTLVPLLQGAHTWDTEWLRLVHVRSAAHSFPFSWWQSGRTEIPRFLMVAALAAMALRFPIPAETRRRLGAIVMACLVLFTVGVAGSEIVPVPLVIRAQLFRASSLLYLLLLILIAHGVACAWQHWRAGAAANDPQMSPWSLHGEAAAAVLVVPVMASPEWLGLLPVAVFVVALAALLSNRLTMPQSLLAGGALLVAFIAHHDLHFPLFTLPTAASELGLLRHRVVQLALLALGTVACAAFLPVGRMTSGLVRGAAIACAIALLRLTYLCRGSADQADTWVQAQLWARQHTPVGATFLTPSAPGGFRLHSERAIVGEWRDGTQQYFDPAFARLWWQRIEALQPDLQYDDTGRHQISDGKTLNDLTDDQLETLCREFQATHLVLPVAAPHNFVPCYSNRDWVIYAASRPPSAPPPAGVINADVWRQQLAFRANTILPNIQRYRTSDVRLQVVDTQGRPLQDCPLQIRQTDSLFRFGSAIGYFVHPPVTTNRPDGSAYDVEPQELEYFPQIFNFSITGYSGKWAVMEPERGRLCYDDLDNYVDWCQQHGIRIQFHFVTGYEPRWLKALPVAEQEACLHQRAGALLARYGDRIESWQVINEKHLLQLTPSTFALMQKTRPGVPLGISDCAMFWSSKPPPSREKEMTRGMLNQLHWLREQGTLVDFVGLHGHRPFTLWADLRDVYKLFDTFAQEGVRIYVTEFGVEGGAAMVGPVRTGPWTDELQAEYYAWIFETCFSHPAVDGINFWGLGPHTFVRRAGLLDESYTPKPAFHTLKRLIRETWRTNLSGTAGLDGSFAFRGYHGDYTVTVTPSDRPPTNFAFRIHPGSNTIFRFVVADQ